MKRITVIVFVVLVLVLVGCENRSPTVKTSVDTELYADGTVASYNVFANTLHIGEITYTFTHEEIDGEKVLRISNVSSTIFTDEAHGVMQEIESTGDVVVMFDNWKPVSSNYSLSWGGDISGWHKTKSIYGKGMVSWSEETPAGSRSNEIKFIETFEGEEYLDGDEVVWHVGTIPYKPDLRKYFTYFTNKSGTPLQGIIWMGEEHDIKINREIYHTFGTGIRVNEYTQRLWYEKDTGRMIKYEQDQGYMSYPGAPRLEVGTDEIPKMTLTLTLKEWKTPTE